MAKRAKMISVGHMSEVQKERAIVVHSLMTNIPMNVGKLIFSQINLSVSNINVALYFPIIITELCANAGV